MNAGTSGESSPGKPPARSGAQENDAARRTILDELEENADQDATLAAKLSRQDKAPSADEIADANQEVEDFLTSMKKPALTAEDLLNTALAASPLADAGIILARDTEGKAEDSNWRQLEGQIQATRRAWLTSCFNYWKRDTPETEHAFDTARIAYTQGLYQLKAAFEGVKGFPDHAEFLRDFMVNDEEALDAIKAAVLSEKRAATYARARSIINRMTKNARSIILAAVSVFMLSQDLPWQTELPTYQPTATRLRGTYKNPEPIQRAPQSIVEHAKRGDGAIRVFRRLIARMPAGEARDHFLAGISAETRARFPNDADALAYHLHFMREAQSGELLSTADLHAPRGQIALRSAELDEGATFTFDARGLMFQRSPTSEPKLIADANGVLIGGGYTGPYLEGN